MFFSATLSYHTFTHFFFFAGTHRTPATSCAIDPSTGKETGNVTSTHIPPKDDTIL